MEDLINKEVGGKPRKSKIIVKEYVISILLGALIAAPIWLFIARPFLVNGGSMNPSFNVRAGEFHLGDYIILDLLSYRFSEPSRGDVIVFSRDKKLIKRIIGLPNETIELKDDKVVITQADGDSYELEEPYVNQTMGKITYASKTFILKEGEYFVLGDNRNNSYDSRFWGDRARKRYYRKCVFCDSTL